jgi:hypothetical protein
MNNLHYYTFLVQNMINAKNKIYDFKLCLMSHKVDEDTGLEGMANLFATLTECILNSLEAICELYFSLEENDQILKNRIINLHKLEVAQMVQFCKTKEEYCFIHKFLELQI